MSCSYVGSIKKSISILAADIENLANKVQEKLKEATPKEGR